MSGKADSHRSIPHPGEWQELLERSDLPPGERDALQKLALALSQGLAEPEPARRGFQAELRSRLLDHARQVLTEEPRAATGATGAAIGAVGATPDRREADRRSPMHRRRSRRPGRSWAGLAGWATVAAAAAGVILWLGRPGVAPLPASTPGQVAQDPGGSGAGSGQTPGTGAATGTELPVSPPVELPGGGMGPGPATTAGEPGGSPTPAVTAPAGAVMAHAGVQAPANQAAGVGSAPLHLTWAVAETAVLPGQVTLYALDTQAWSPTTLERAARVVSPSRAETLGRGGLDARSEDGLRRLRLSPDHVLTYQAATGTPGGGTAETGTAGPGPSPGGEPAPGDAETATGAVGSSVPEPGQAGRGVVLTPTPEGALAAAQDFLVRLGLDPQGSPEAYSQPDGTWTVVWTPSLNGYPLVGGSGRMHLTPELQVTYLELRRLVAAPGPLAALRSPAEAARELEGQRVAGSGQVRITGVSLVYMPAPGQSGEEWAAPYYRFTGETSEGWPYVGYVSAVPPAGNQ